MEIFDKVKAVLTEICGVESIRPEQELQHDLALDSLQLVTLLMLLEENFQIVLEESDMNPFDLINVYDVINLVEKYTDGNRNETEEKN